MGIGPSKAWSVFGLTSFSLVGLVDTPFFVVELRDIEIVNLAKLEPEKIHMTVVLRTSSLIRFKSTQFPWTRTIS